MSRVFNFNPGPSTLPVEVLEQVQKELLEYHGTGMSIIETSHRAKPFEEVIFGAEALLKELLNVPDDYRVLFLHGGASLQFDMIPMNYLTEGKTADYILTGSFADKAYKEGKVVGNTNVAASTKETKYTRIVNQEEIKLSANSAYVHICTNNTIEGTQWQYIPQVGEVPLIADMSSDILSKQIDVSKYALIYAGAQKNLGPSGLAVVIIRKDMLEKANKALPAMLRYDIHADNDSLYNTPPSFTIYVVRLMLEWVKAQGGVAAIQKRNEAKAKLIYDAIDASNGFYKGHAEAGSRSLMNITFRLPNEDLDKAFVSEATKLELTGLKGHRSVGGIRASIYNAMPEEGCRKLADFMADFAKKNA